LWGIGLEMDRSHDSKTEARNKFKICSILVSKNGYAGGVKWHISSERIKRSCSYN
jgi:hypothetical protein